MLAKAEMATPKPFRAAMTGGPEATISTAAAIPAGCDAVADSPGQPRRPMPFTALIHPFTALIHFEDCR